MTAAACFKLAGEWDFTRRYELQTILRPAESLDEVLLDFSAVTFIDASVMGCLLRLRRRMIEHGCLGTIRIIAASGHIVHLFEICELGEIFGFGAPAIYEDDENSLVKPSLIRCSVFARA
jgi:anti-anti-sigma factor